MKTALLVFIATGISVSGVAGQASPPHMAHGTSYVGVMVQEIDSDRAKALHLRDEAGVEITRVEPDSPAEKAGLKPGDTILQYNGEHVEGMEQFSRLVRETPAGRDVKLNIVRNGVPQMATVKVATRRALPGFAIAPAVAAMPPYALRMPDIPRSFMTWRSPALGIECERLAGQLADYFGVKEGVLVRWVSSGSAAEKAGVRAGDVITRVDDSKVATPADLSSRIHSAPPGKPVPITVMRDRKEVALSVSIGNEDRGQR